MNAIQFIKEQGVDKAREVVEGAPEGSTHFVGSTYLKLIGAVWWNAWLPEWSHKDNCMVKKWKCESIELMKTWGEVYKLDDLKRLVESLDLVKSYGGIINAKHDVKYLDLDWDYDTPRVTRLKQAIADYESIYGVSMFKVGEAVVLKNSSQNKVMKIQAYNDEFIRAYYGDQDYSFAHESNFRHATEQEIAAGHRIDCEILDYPEDYTSPLCKKFDEQVK